jgi:signal transduction histidine kinase
LSARQQVAALRGLGGRDQGKVFAQRLLAQLRVVHALVGRFETGLSGRRHEKQPDQEADQQHRRQRDIPAAALAEVFAQESHRLRTSLTAGKSSM